MPPANAGTKGNAPTAATGEALVKQSKYAKDVK